MSCRGKEIRMIDLLIVVVGMSLLIVWLCVVMTVAAAVSLCIGKKLVDWLL